MILYHHQSLSRGMKRYSLCHCFTPSRPAVLFNPSYDVKCVSELYRPYLCGGIILFTFLSTLCMYVCALCLYAAFGFSWFFLSDRLYFAISSTCNHRKWKKTLNFWNRRRKDGMKENEKKSERFLPHHIFRSFGPIRFRASFDDLKQQYMIDYNISCEVFMNDNLCPHYALEIMSDVMEYWRERTKASRMGTFCYKAMRKKKEIEREKESEKMCNSHHSFASGFNSMLWKCEMMLGYGWHWRLSLSLSSFFHCVFFSFDCLSSGKITQPSK